MSKNMSCNCYIGSHPRFYSVGSRLNSPCNDKPRYPRRCLAVMNKEGFPGFTVLSRLTSICAAQVEEIGVEFPDSRTELKGNRAKYCNDPPELTCTSSF